MPSAIAVKEMAKVGGKRRAAKGLDDLDFYIGDEALEASNYAVKVSIVRNMLWSLYGLICLCCDYVI